MSRTLSFDGLLTDANGVSLEVDCEVSPPIVGGRRAAIRVSIPSTQTNVPPLHNPCSLSGHLGQLRIAFNDVWYRFLPFHNPTRRHANADIGLSHVGGLTTVEHLPSPTNQNEMRFLISPVYFLQIGLKGARFTSLPTAAELFRIQVPDLGEVTFCVDWKTEYQGGSQDPGGSIYPCYFARVLLDDTDSRTPHELAEAFRSALMLLSVLFRQAVTLHGWIRTRPSLIESHWVEPLEPNFAPSRAAENGRFVVFPEEFQDCAASILRQHAAADAKVKALIGHLSVAAAPHIDLPTATRFVAMFSILERVVDFAFKQDSANRCDTSSDSAFLQHLEEMRSRIQHASGPAMHTLLERTDGIMRNVRFSRPSFGHKLASLLCTYPQLGHWTSDLWPITGSEAVPGLKQIRDRLSHGSNEDINYQSLAVATWHLSICIERLVFILLGANVPEGIGLHSPLLDSWVREWYSRPYWEDLQARAWKV